MLFRLVFCLLCFRGFSQPSQVDPKKVTFVFQLDNRYSNLRGVSITIFGAKTGIQYKNWFRAGVGGSFILHPVTIAYRNKKTNATIENHVSFWYASLFNDWIVYKNTQWECFITEQIGYGKPSFLKEVNNEIVSDATVALYVNELSGQVNYKITPFLGVGIGVGYRNILNSKALLKHTFEAPIYIGKIILYPDAVLKKLK